MKYKRMGSLLLVLALLAGLMSGCHTDPEPTQTTQAARTEPATQTAEPTTEPAPAPEEEYRTALAALQAEPALTVVSELSTACTVGGVTVTEDQKETVRSQGRGGEDLTVSARRELLYNQGAYNSRSTVFTQLYRAGELYTEVSESRFYAPETEENFLGQLTPAALLDPDNYGQVVREGDRIIFSEPLAPERWAMPAGAHFETAEGWAEVKDGVLLRQGYELSCTLAGTPITFTCSSELAAGVDEDLSALIPSDRIGYIELESTEALFVLARTREAVLHAKMFTLELSEARIFQASNWIEQAQTECSIYGTGKEALAAEEVRAQVLDLQGNKTGEDETMTYLLDETGFTTTHNDEAPQTQTLNNLEHSSIGRTIREGIQDTILGCLPDYDVLTGATVYDMGDFYLVEFTCGEELSRKIDRQLNLENFGDENAHKKLSDRYDPVTMEGYVAIEKVTWMPTAASMIYVGRYVISGTPCAIGYQRDFSISLYNLDTYKKITGEPMPDTEPEQKADPVFYEVKGENGETLYLFGTIHVGDDRTGYLPQTIYDAFDSADALAVEFDDAVFEQQIAEDPSLLERVAGAYYYLDGSTTKDHLDEEVYDSAVRFLKITGDYSSQSEMMKPFVWGNALENFYLAQGRKLTSSKGMDNRLMDRARAQEKEILSVESGISQLEMLANYSDKLQQVLLEEAMGTSRTEYLDNVYELYDLWCEGDEAVLIERLAGADEAELSEMTEEEQALYEEYHSAMETDRNEKMLETAVDYLSGGKTVFFAVGLAHLLGDGGLVRALRDAGYTVTLIQGG